MKDYKELIDRFRGIEQYGDGHDDRFIGVLIDPNEAKYVADAIEQLVKERNEALNRLSWEEEASVERERERMLESCRNGDVYL